MESIDTSTFFFGRCCDPPKFDILQLFQPVDIYCQVLIEIIILINWVVIGHYVRSSDVIVEAEMAVTLPIAPRYRCQN